MADFVTIPFELITQHVVFYFVVYECSNFNSMDRKDFLKSLIGITAMGTLSSFKSFTDGLPVQPKKMPVLFTSHGNPFDIVKSKEEKRFWNALHNLGLKLQKEHEVKAAFVVSAHWCTTGTFVNVSPTQKQIFDYYGFPKEYYEVYYNAQGAPEVAREIKAYVDSVKETTDWGLDHGAWPMLMHLFPMADVPVFQMSIDYNAKPQYHYKLGQQLKKLREKGVLIIGSGALIHNLSLGMKKIREGDNTLYGWELEYDAWLKKQIDARNFTDLINYTSSHNLGKLASPTPDHFVPVLYSLGLMDSTDQIQHFFEDHPSLPAFSERSFLITS